MSRRPYDLVVFWKQNDTGIYGRRSDLLVAELACSQRVRCATHFDAPIGAEALRRLGESDGADHDRLIFEHTTAATASGLAGGFCRRTFVYDDRAGVAPGPALTDRFGDFVAEVLEARGVGRRRPTVFLVYPTNRHLPALLDRFHPRVVVADVVDDNRTWYAEGSSQHALLTANYREVLARSDVVLANCAGVVDAMSAFHDRVELVPNACEPPDAIDVVEAVRPPELARLRGPVVGYAGNLSSRIDVDLLDHVASSRPRWNIVLIGSTHAGRDARRLGDLPNVTLLGPRAYEDAKRYIRSFDVAIIPHLDDPMTRSMQPLKAYVYAALGVPVVATPIANLPDLGPIITVAGDPDGFVDAIERRLARGRRALTPETVRALQANSWPVRAARVLDLIDQALAARPSRAVGRRRPARPAISERAPSV